MSVSFDSEDDLQGKDEIWDATFAFGKSMALKAAIRLGIADVIARRGADALLTIEEIAEGTSTKNLDIVRRILRFLTHSNIFREEKVDSESRYGLTRASKWIVRDQQLDLSPLILMVLDKTLESPWHYFHECATEEGGSNMDAFKRANGKSIWEFAGDNPWFTKLFSDGMAAGSVIWVHDIANYKDVFGGIETLVDVGGGPGVFVSRIVQAYPGIKGINFDLPHVVAQAPVLSGVEHVGGDMFNSTIPFGDGIIIKAVLHNWDDENCIKILVNCSKALSDNGKLIIVELVIDEAPDLGVAFDLMMLADTKSGRTRSRDEWSKLLASAGFFRLKVHKMKSKMCLIEAFKS